MTSTPGRPTGSTVWTSAGLDTVVQVRPSGLSELAGIGRDDADWLHDMWTDKPVGWFVQWECIGHGHTHVGEMVSVRNRMGLSPF